MKITQKDDGSAEIKFSEKEVEIISKHKKLVLTTEFLKHFINLFMGVFFEFQKKFDEKTKQIMTTKHQEIKTKAPKDDL